jgi:uncharacterized protein YndB with AHSA1/START domain
MDAASESERSPVNDGKVGSTNHTTLDRRSDRELVIKRTFNGPARLVFEAWTKAELFKRWWVPKSFGLTLLSCEMDVRTGGAYRLVFARGDAEPMAFYGSYREVTPHLRLVWTNEEGGPDNAQVTTVTFEEKGGKTLVVMTELHPSKESLDESCASGVQPGMLEAFEQLAELLVDLGASVKK